MEAQTAGTRIDVGGGGDPPLRWRGLQRVASALDETANLLILAGKTLVAAAVPPYEWRYEFIDQAWLAVRRAFLPTLIGIFALAWGAGGVTVATLLDIFGALDRLGGLYATIGTREVAPWVTGMVIAGVAGTAVTADLGARKVREEIDALAVLGIDPIRSLVVPRFLALGLVTIGMELFCILGALVSGWTSYVLVNGGTTGGYIATFGFAFSPVELLGAMVKTSIFGFIVGITSCYKGLNVSGGAEGVGRAVNQAVVMAFMAIWVFNYMFTATFLALYPGLGDLR